MSSACVMPVSPSQISSLGGPHWMPSHIVSIAFIRVGVVLSGMTLGRLPTDTSVQHVENDELVDEDQVALYFHIESVRKVYTA